MKELSVIFDLDGTLVDSQTDIRNSLLRTFLHYNLNIDPVRIRIGPPLNELIENILGITEPKFLNDIIVFFRETYKHCGFFNTHYYPMIYQFLLDLKKMQVPVFLATNKPFGLTKKIISLLGEDFFQDKIVAIDSIPGSKLSKAEMINFLYNRFQFNKYSTFMIGDSPNDILAAKENNVFSVAVGYGYYDETELMLTKPYYFCRTVNELIGYFKNKKDE